MTDDKELQPCEPHKCSYFKRAYEASYTKLLADQIFLKCSGFKYPNKCSNPSRKEIGH